MNKRLIVILVGSCVVLASAGVFTYAMWPVTAPDPVTQTRGQAVKYLASKEFSKLDPEKKQEYFDAAWEDRNYWQRPRDANLTDEETKNLRKNIRPLFRRRMEQRLDKYFELPPAERTAYLDEVIDRIQQRWSRDPNRARRSGRRRGRFTPGRVRGMIERTTPEQRAKFDEFRKAMRKRMRERGVERR